VSFFFDRIETPIGEAQFVCDAEGRLHRFGWYEGDRAPSRFVDLAQKRDPFGLSTAIRDYFTGHVAAIDALPVVFSGTAFQVRVWNALRTIAAGETESYGALAKRIGDPKAVRAVGLANGANPIGVIVPCHRVIGADGSLTGYGGGLERKKWLLAHEARHAGSGLFGKEAMR
jgi:methylated-DNA-[protein]-cysteine S-methyltransferase